MAEEELAVFDLLTQPAPLLTEEEGKTVKARARELLAHLHEKLVQDWRRKVDVTNDVNSTIRRVVDEARPRSPTPRTSSPHIPIGFLHRGRKSLMRKVP